MTKNQKNVIKWIIGVIALIIGGYCVVELVGDPMNPDKEPLFGTGWLIGGLVFACAVFGWYTYQVVFGETKDDKVEEKSKPEGDGGIEVEA